MHAVILFHHRRIAPFGLNGGEWAKSDAIDWNVTPAVLKRLALPPACSLKPGDAVVIDTPVGNGCGKDDDCPA
jgi:N-methylhydantoinase B/oxoprolinase/acetone carboxylase alpha subunit